MAYFDLLLSRGTQESSSNEQLVQGLPVCGRLHRTLRAWHDWQATGARLLDCRVLPVLRGLSFAELGIMETAVWSLRMKEHQCGNVAADKEDMER
ncbi:hypothetical protein DPV78_009080 [Talaromyces pinophilus]|nr:hypothetical protein DPV78_009080 [Talaromyces pinophilus]